MPSWAAAHAEYQVERERLAALEKQAAEAPLTVAEKLERSKLRSSLLGNEAVLDEVRVLAEAHPDSAEAQFLAGQVLLELDDPEGLARMERVRELEPTATQYALQHIAAYHSRQGNRHVVEEIKETALDSYASEAAFDMQASRSAPTDELLPTDLTEEQIAAIRKQLEALGDVEWAYISNRRLEQWPNRPVRLLVAHPRRKFARDGQELRQKLHHRLASEVDYGCEIFIFVPESWKKWRERLETVPGAKVVDAKGS